jgi:hypothetical protein
MNFQTLLNSVKDGDVFIQLYEKYSVNTLDIPIEYTNTIFYISQYIKKAFEHNQLKTANYLLDRLDKQESTIFGFIRLLVSNAVELVHIQYVINYLRPNTSIIEHLLFYHITIFEEYVEMYLTSFWNITYTANPHILLDVIELFMNIHKPPYSAFFGVRHIGKLILSKYYEEIDVAMSINYWTSGLKNRVLRELPNKEMLKLLKYTEDFNMEFFKVSKVIVPKSHSLYPKYIEYHKPKIIYTKKIWEIIGVSINSDVIA